jgi:bifunctional N-acetylglucosamine-1-phosphate-uridyltransferase/glucosamine-1-phosphate-acetyltransferase GlmU-like protein
LYSHINQLVESGMPYQEAITATTDELDEAAEWGAKKKQVRERLAALLENKDAHQRFRKIQRLQSGFIPNAVGFSTFVDLRPDG